MADTKKPLAPVLIRRSAYLMLVKLVLLEFFTLGIFLAIRIPLHFLLTTRIELSVFLMFTILYAALSISKLILVVSIVLMWMNDYYEVLPGTLVHRRGVFSTKTDTFSLTNIEMEEVKQHLIGKIFHFGTVEIWNPLIKRRFKMLDVSHPHKCLNTIVHQSKAGQADQNLPGVKIMPMP